MLFILQPVSNLHISIRTGYSSKPTPLICAEIAPLNVSRFLKLAAMSTFLALAAVPFISVAIVLI